MRKPFKSRMGTAVVEFAILLPLLLLLLCGVWVVGRMIQVHQILDWAAREGARTASQGQIINLTDAYQQIKVVDPVPTNLSVTTVVNGYLTANEINTTGLVIEFVNLTSGLPQPHQAIKGDHLSITLRLPHDNVRYPAPINIPGFGGGNLPVPDMLTTTLEFYSLQDDPFTVNDVLPTWDPLS